MSRRRRTLLAAVTFLAGCGGDAGEGDRQREPRQGPSRAGDGVDAGRVAVPRNDPSPPTARIVLATARGRPLAEESQPPRPGPHGVAELREPRLLATSVGRDPDGGVARVRVSLKERITCVSKGQATERPRVRYFPPPQVERIRSNPGALLPGEKARTLALTLGRGGCGDAQAVEVEAELWGEAINGGGLEAVTPHVRLRWGR